MPNNQACTNRGVLRNQSRLAIFKECFAAVLGTSGLLATSTLTLAQNDRDAFANRYPNQNGRLEHSSQASQPSNLSARTRNESAGNYLPASPWSKQVSFEQPVTPNQEKITPSNVVRQPSRKLQEAMEVNNAPVITWGRIREIDSREETETKGLAYGNPIELPEKPSVHRVPQNHIIEESPAIELVPSAKNESRLVKTDSPASRGDDSKRIQDDEQGIFLLPTLPQGNESSSRSVGQFASSREMMTKERYEMSIAEPSQTAVSPVTHPSMQEAERMRIAQMQSHELQSIPLEPAYAEPRLLESPIGWKAIRQELAKHLETCDSLLKRGATHSARAEILVGLRKLFRAMDLHRGITHSETCFEAALTAMREETDFHNLQMSRSVSSIVAMHTTPALKNRPLDSVTTELACQHYRAFARYQMAQAADGHLYAADLLYALGKTLEKDAELNSDRAQQLRSQAVICYQTAIQLRPNQHHASNQLGYALIHLDRIEEAYDALKSSIEAKPNPQAWTNLAEIYRRRGAATEANYAVQQAMALGGGQASDKLDITQVDPAIFAKFSPALNANGAPTQSTSSTPPQSPAYPQTAKAGNFFTKMFR